MEQEAHDSTEDIDSAEDIESVYKKETGPGHARAKAAALQFEKTTQDQPFNQFLDEQYRLINGKLVGKLTKELGYDAALDVAGQTWTKACRSLHRFDPEKGSFNSWLWKIAHNSKVDHLIKVGDRWKKELGQDISEMWNESPRDVYAHYVPNPEMIAIRADLEETIAGLGEYLKLDSTQQQILLFLLYSPDDEEEEAISNADRQRRTRLRKKIDELTGLDPEEKEAVRLMRRHHSYQNILSAHSLDEAAFKITYRRACDKLLRLLTKEIEGNEPND
ncbi:sigma factor [Arthrobacter sp. H14-L1]|uniref:sigma factor n=1 Tax=Arthrobacter sp. H14-L1 TaxID=2996697 RepID=UPI0022709BF9|nr:sigma factor [Arthrobacter sp. H14-L1]MCY0905760.1 hypothetical protein [Arthrobacter sp. H14-L1]